MANLRTTIKTFVQDDKGVGDTIKRVTAAVGVKPCGGCQKRTELLNKKFPYHK